MRLRHDPTLRGATPFHFSNSKSTTSRNFPSRSAFDRPAQRPLISRRLSPSTTFRLCWSRSSKPKLFHLCPPRAGALPPPATSNRAKIRRRALLPLLRQAMAPSLPKGTIGRKFILRYPTSSSFSVQLKHEKPATFQVAGFGINVRKPASICARFRQRIRSMGGTNGCWRIARTDALSNRRRANTRKSP